MKIGILADIHANLPALESVIRAAQSIKIEKWFVLGDLVGYYYWPLACIEMLRKLDAEIIAGNHDRMVCDCFDAPELLAPLVEQYGSGHRIVVEQLSNLDAKWLDMLQSNKNIKIKGKTVHLCHGSPWNPSEYIYPDSPVEIWKNATNLGCNLIFYGHSHYANLVEYKEILIVNPGSVGQPRDRLGGAQWAIWDLDTDNISFRREEYDTSVVVERCMENDRQYEYLVKVFGG